MAQETSLLLIYALCVIAMLLSQSVLTYFQHGLELLVGDREGIFATGAAGRAERAFSNTLISLVFLCIPVFIMALADYSTSSTIFAMKVFISARIFYFLSYILSIAYLRSCLWWIGLLSTLYLFYVAIFVTQAN